MKLSVCVCCLQKCLAVVDKERVVIKLWTKLFSLKTEKTDTNTSETPCICFKCYLRLKLCFVYRQSFVYLHKHFDDDSDQWDPTEFTPELNNVPIISNCPICFKSQPSAKHIYEHLLQQGEKNNARGCNSFKFRGLTCERREDCRRSKAARTYYCRGMCGASFMHKQLRDTHQLGCKNIQGDPNMDPGDESDTSTDLVCNSPTPTISDFVSVMLSERDGSSEDEKMEANGSFFPTNNATCTSIKRNATEASQKPASTSAPVRQSARKSSHKLIDDSTRKPSDNICRRNVEKVECQYCHKPFAIGLRVQRHEAKFCSLRPYCPTVENEKTILPVQNCYKRCCTICGKWVNKLRQHLLTHSATPQFECQHCHKRFKNIVRQKMHQAACPLLQNGPKQDLTEKPFVCDTCGKSFALNGLLSQHKKAHIRFPCSVCNAMISKASESLHMLTVHDNVSMVCDFCGKVQKNRYVLNSHIKRHHQDEADWLACDKCDKKFKDKQQLKLHSTTHVVGQNEFSCEKCGLRFFSNITLQNHIRTVHKRTTSRECSVCGLVLSSSSTLKVHERQHTGVKPYICDLCGKAFTQKPPLNRHKRTQHGIMPPLVEQCPHCDKMFPSKAVLKSHMIKSH